MGRVGRPRSVDRPPCPECERVDRVVAHGLQTVDGAPRRAFRCRRCRRGFVPGKGQRRPDDALRAAVRRVRRETDANYRLLAAALTNHLGVSVSHTTVGAWCRADGDDDADGDRVPCEYLSLLWALRQEIEADLSERTG